MKKALIITIFAISSVIMGGAACFTYAGSTSTSVNTGVSVAEFVTIGDIEVSGEYKIIFDTSTIYTTCNVSASIKNQDSNDSYTENINRTYSFNFDAFSQYITVTGTTSGTWEDDVAITSPELAWNSDISSKTGEELSDIVSTLSKEKVTITFKAEV